MVKEFAKLILVFVVAVLFLAILGIISEAAAAPPQKSKFYDFNEQVIDGEIKKPTSIYVDSRQKAKFDRLLRLKKSFLPKLFKTSKNKVFK